ncbi:MAG TPA: hypothetical protein VL068_02140 [Microthrixaceae bacterium]|nr:hypothetical protein [Microthrixaceae bacterium]
MATLSADLMIQPIGREPLKVADQVTMFHLALVVLDPYTYESSWVLETAGRILTEFGEADCRAGWLVTADDKDTKAFLGPWADSLMTFCDPERTTVKGMGIETLPALIHIGNDESVIGKSEGWDPDGWREITDNLATMMSWSRPLIPITGDPVPFEGSPAQG